MSEELRRTQGPLEINKLKCGDVEITEDGSPLAVCFGDQNDPSCWPAEGNAKMFAAAPDLLVVAKKVFALEVSTSNKGILDLSTIDLLELYEAARTAIAKAEGRQ